MFNSRCFRVKSWSKVTKTNAIRNWLVNTWFVANVTASSNADIETSSPSNSLIKKIIRVVFILYQNRNKYSETVHFRVWNATILLSREQSLPIPLNSVTTFYWLLKIFDRFIYSVTHITRDSFEFKRINFKIWPFLVLEYKQFYRLAKRWVKRNQIWIPYRVHFHPNLWWSNQLSIRESEMILWLMTVENLF